MVDPIFTYVGGIAFLVLIIGTMLYLTFSTMDIEEGDEHPGESVVGGIGAQAEEGEFESAEPRDEDPGSVGSEEVVADEPDEESVDEADAEEEADEADAGTDDESDGNTEENA